MISIDKIADSLGGSPFAKVNDNIDNTCLMKTWLRNQEHTAPRESSQFLPTRLLDLRAFPQSEDVRLVRSRDIQAAATPPYLALSHCWGGNVPVQLKKETIETWMESGIPYDKLPKTFQDAVRITKQLGFRYLWIDSMSIVQNSPEDWQHEASLMAKVYGKSHCTLAALSSKNSSEGCRLNESIQSSLNTPYVEVENEGDSTTPRVRIFKELPRTWIEEFNGRPDETIAETESPLRTRAWVLQEKELSNCTIYFGKNQLLWESQGFKATSQIPWEEMKPKKQSDTPRMVYMTDKGKKMQGGPPRPWFELVEDYTSRSLSFPGDKLIAFSGLAKKFEQYRGHYYGGIWSTDFLDGLLWRTKDDSASRPKYLAPSWSWASLMGPVTYDSLRIEPDKDYAHFEHPEDVYDGLHTIDIKSVDVSLEDNTKPYGDIREGRLILGGVRCIKVECGGKGVVHFPDGGQPLIRNERTIGCFYPDIASETALVKEAHCVALHSESIWSLDRHEFRLKQDREMISLVMGIVVAKLPKSREFSRIGLARWIDESLFDSVQLTTIEIV